MGVGFDDFVGFDSPGVGFDGDLTGGTTGQPLVTRPRARVLALMLGTNVSGDGDRYFATLGNATGPDGIAAERHFEGRLVGDPAFTRQVTFPTEGAGAVAMQNGIGNFTIDDSDEEHFEWLTQHDNRDREFRAWVTPWPFYQLDTEGVEVARGVIDRTERVGPLGQLFVRDTVSALLDKPFQANLFPDTIENEAERGTPMPFLLGVPEHVPTVQTDLNPVQRFAVHEDAAYGSALLYPLPVLSKGDPLSEGAQFIRYNAAPTFGFERTTAVAGVQTVRQPIGYLTAYSIVTAAEYIARVRGGVSAAQFDLAGLSALNPYDYQVAAYIRGGTIREWLKRVLASSFTDFYLDPTGVLRFVRLQDPSLLAPAFTITQGDVAGDVRYYDDTAPGLSTRMIYARNWAVLDESDLNTALLDPLDQSTADLMAEYKTVTYQATPLAPMYAHAYGAAPFDSLLRYQTEAQAEINRVCSLYTVRRRNVDIPVFVERFGALPLPGQAFEYEGETFLAKRVVSSLSGVRATITGWG